MVLFDKAGKQNTEKTAAIAVEAALRLGCDMVVASHSGLSARAVYEQAQKLGYGGKIVVVRGVSSAAANGVNRMSPQTRAELEALGMQVVTAAHALSAGERGLSSAFHGVYPLEIMAHTLRTFGQGVKVCFECAVMALDADAVGFGRPVVAVAGTGSGGGGADTAMVLTPSYSATITKTQVHEILCKPGLYPEAL